MAELLVRGGTLVDETGERRADLLVRGCEIAEVAESLEAPVGAKVLEADGCVVAPGLVDLHAHLRQPGGEAAETVESGSRAAALGGYSAVVAMPNTDPPIDDVAVARYVIELGSSALCQVAVAGAITRGRLGRELAPIGELAAMGIVLFTDDGSGVQDASVMRQALSYASDLGVVLAEHCQDDELAAGGQMNEGASSSLLGIPGQPAIAEEQMLARDLALVRETGCQMHFLHLSTAGSVDLVARAKRDGLPVTAEVAPHHLYFTDEEVASFDPLFKVNPPLRRETDRLALVDALREGIVDAVATDHAPHADQEKERPFEEASPGMLGLETALSVLNTVMGGTLGLRQILAAMSWRPARIARLDRSSGGRHGGPLTEGAPANLLVFDPAERFAVDCSRLASKSRNSPYHGRELDGRVRHMVFEGEPVVVSGEAQR